MAQPFQCLCNTPLCRGTISGAKHMKPSQLGGYWLNTHIRQLLEEQQQHSPPENGTAADPTAQALRNSLSRAEQSAEAARAALRTYLHGVEGAGVNGDAVAAANGDAGLGKGLGRRGQTSRELSGEMGGDTVYA